MPDASVLLEHWGYAGIVLAVLLGFITPERLQVSRFMARDGGVAVFLAGS